MRATSARPAGELGFEIAAWRGPGWLDASAYRDGAGSLLHRITEEQTTVARTTRKMSRERKHAIALAFSGLFIYTAWDNFQRDLYADAFGCFVLGVIYPAFMILFRASRT